MERKFRKRPGDQAQTFIKIKIDLAQMAAPALANLEKSRGKIKLR